MIEDVRIAVRRCLADLRSSTVLVACSGGADSLALARAVALEAPRADVHAVVIVVDHDLQEGSAAVAERAAQKCRDLGLESEVVRVTVVLMGEGMEAAAKHPNVYCKVSALVEQTGQKPAPRDMAYYRPVLDTLWTLFGEDRLIFGSNWPISNGGAPYETVLGLVSD